MEKIQTIEIISHFHGSGEKLRRRVEARYSLRETEARLAYKQQLDPDSPRLTPEVLTVSLDEGGRPQRVVMKRPGSRFQLTFSLGEACASLYDTPAGLMEVSLLTQKLDGCFTPDRIELRLQYELRLGGDSQGVTELTVKA